MSTINSPLAEDLEGLTEPDGQAPAKEPKPSPRILLVDDEEYVLKALRRIFRKEDYTLLTALSSGEALEIIKKEPVQVVISDHRMPGMTGADLLRKVKVMYPRIIRIMLTGHADVNAIMGAVNEGAVFKFITKPWNDDDLRLTVRLALDQHQLVEENTSLKLEREEQDKTIKKLSRFAVVNRSQIGPILLKKKLINQQQLDKALTIQSKTGKLLPMVLIEIGAVTEATILKTMQSELGIRHVHPDQFQVTQVLTSLIPPDICRKSLLVPLQKKDGRLVVAMADPSDLYKTDDLKFITGFPIEPVLATQKEIAEKLQVLHGDHSLLLQTALAEFDEEDSGENIEIILEEEEEKTDLESMMDAEAETQPPVIRIVNTLISSAMIQGASDIHIEPKARYTRIRYRIDGLLREKHRLPFAMHPQIVSRIKIMCELDISERRKPQDGRVAIRTPSRSVDMRISILPTVSGEKVVMRILDKRASIRDIEDLGASEEVLAKISQFIAQPQGIVLSTGPTGSGKTTTLYSLLRTNATITKNYTTIEDPVEYHMGMAEQVQVREKIGLSFPVILRSILRQDPNVIMLGEIRDYETAEVAHHAAMTGHLVLSTLHTNSTVASVTRLRDMGIKSYVISEALIGIIAQRLLRCICPHCKTADEPHRAILHALRLDRTAMDFTPQKGAGCDRCEKTGYSGRIGIFEVFQVDDELREMIHREATEKEIVKAAQQGGMRTLFEDAIDKIRTGVTTCKEVLRVLGPQHTLLIRCGQCQAQLEERFQYCPFCGGVIIPHCQGCGSQVAADWKVCAACGQGL